MPVKTVGGDSKLDRFDFRGLFGYLYDHGYYTLLQPGGVLCDAFELGLSYQPGPGHGQVHPLGHRVVHALVHGELIVAVRVIRYGPVVKYPLDAGHRFARNLATDRQLVVVQLKRGALDGILDDRLTGKLVGFDGVPQLVQQPGRFGARRPYVKVLVHDLFNNNPKIKYKKKQ